MATPVMSPRQSHLTLPASLRKISTASTGATPRLQESKKAVSRSIMLQKTQSQSASVTDTGDDGGGGGDGNGGDELWALSSDSTQLARIDGAAASAARASDGSVDHARQRRISAAITAARRRLHEK
jgi:hypothetical protein